MLNFIGGDSELAGRIRAHRWAATALGPAETWPDSLKTLVSVMLAANQQMYIVWGPSRALLYNDRYAEVLQAHHPDALGRNFLDVWSEIADDLTPLVERAYAGVPAYQDDILLLLQRGGRTVETHFTYSYTPVFNAGGGVDGFICHCIETTEQVNAGRALRESEERQAFLLQLSDALRLLVDPAAITSTACRLLGERLGCDRTYYAEIDEAAGIASVAFNYLRGDSPSLVGTHRLADYGWVGPLLREGKRAAIADVASASFIPDEDRTAMALARISAAIYVPLLKDGALVGSLSVTEPEPRLWTSADIALVQETGERIWAAVERARVENATRQSEAAIAICSRACARDISKTK